MEIRAAAERYCSVIERAESLQREQFVAEVAQSLAELIAAAGRLPPVDPTDAEVLRPLSHEQWREQFVSVQSTLDDWDDYWTAMSPYGGWDMEAVNLPLADDLADVWRDLKEGLLALDAGVPEMEVIWEWRYGFYSHWGRPATEALRVCHARLADTADHRGA
jgi:hypothetical protein